MPKTDAVFLMPNLTGQDGNAYALLGRASSALRAAGCTRDVEDEFHEEATSGDYEHLLSTIMLWFIVLVERPSYERIN